MIRAEILRDGAISFARYMQLALYSPESGYYEAHARTIGRGGDYFTNVSVGPMFGELIAVQILDWIHQHQLSRGKICIVEGGAHNGLLARDILKALRQHAPPLLHRIEYVMLEPSAARQAWQRQTLADFPETVKHVASWNDLEPFEGIALSNELMDAFPLHRFVWDRTHGSWRETGVTLNAEGLAWTILDRDGDDIAAQLTEAGFPAMDSMGDVLPNGYVLEDAPQARAWWRMGAEKLRRGCLVAIDYGGEVKDLLIPERTQGTARAYFQHSVSSDLLERPGLQDLTAHVNFTALERSGNDAGLRTEILSSQERFLTRVLASWAKLHPHTPGWSDQQKAQIRTLIHPNHFGTAFKVLVQSRP